MRTILGLSENVLDLDQQVNVQRDGERQQQDSNENKAADPRAHGAHILDKLLLFQSVAVGGFAHTLQLILDALEGGALLCNLRPQLTMALAQLGHPALHRLQVDVHLWRRRMSGLLRGDQSADRRCQIAIEQGQQLLHKGKGCANGLGHTLKTAFSRVLIRGGGKLRAILGRRSR